MLIPPTSMFIFQEEGCSLSLLVVYLHENVFYASLQLICSSCLCLIWSHSWFLQMTYATERMLSSRGEELQERILGKKYPVSMNICGPIKTWKEKAQENTTENKKTPAKLRTFPLGKSSWTNQLPTKKLQENSLFQRELKNTLASKNI